MSLSLGKLPLPQDFVCPKCLRRMMKGDIVDVSAVHCMYERDGLTGALSSENSDAMTVICPSCSIYSVQCCHCPKTCTKNTLGKKKHSHVMSRTYKLHYQEMHSSSHRTSPSNAVDDNDDIMMDTIDDDEVEFPFCPDGQDDGQHDEVVGTVDDLWLPLSDTSEFGQEVTYEDFVNDTFSSGSYYSSQSSDQTYFEWNAILPFVRHLRSVFRHNPVACRYFLQEIRCCGRAGIQSVVHRATEGDLYLSDLAGTEDTTSLLLLTKIMTSLSVQDRAHLMKYLEGVVNAIIPIIIPGKKMPRIPNGPKDSWKVVIGSDTSVYGQIPHEAVKEVDRNHVSLSVNDMINTQMALGADLNFIVGDNGRDRTGINGTPEAEAALARMRHKIQANGGDPDNTLYGLIAIWSDGFVVSWVKQKDNSCWTLTVTLCPTEGMNPKDTHAIALGLSKYDHSYTVSQIMKQLEPLENGIVRLWSSGGRLRLVNTAFAVICYPADKPERGSLTSTLGHTGNTSKRGNYVGRWSTQFIPSCARCSSNLVMRALNNDSIIDVGTCEQCCDWSYTDRKGWEKAWPVTSDTYPSEPLDETLMQELGIKWPENRKVPFESYIKPMEQTFSWLIEGVKVALLALAIRIWNKGQTTAYLNSFAVSTKVIKATVSDADTLYKEIVGAARHRREGWQDNLKQLLTTTALTSRGVIPEMWVQKLVSLSCFIELPMHEIFLGAIQTIYEVIEEYIKSNKEWEKFLAMVNPFLTEIKLFRLSWCKLEPLPKSSWISENWIAYMRCLPWLVGIYIRNIGSDEVGNAALARLIHTLDVMVSQLMCADQNCDEEKLTLSIKIFLNCCVEFSNHLDRKKRKRRKNQSPESQKDADPFYVKGNFISLLNLVRQIKRFGKLVWYWDGNLEKGIQSLKPNLGRLRKTSKFLRTKLIGVRKDQIFGRIFDSWNSPPLQAKNSHDWFGRTYRFQNEQEINERLIEGQPLPFVQRKDDNRFMIPFGQGKSEDDIHFLSISLIFNNIPRETCVGQFYCSLAAGLVGTIKRETLINGVKYGVFLPNVSKDEDFDNSWTIMTEQREVLRGDSNELSCQCHQEDMMKSLFAPSTVSRNLIGRKIGMVFAFTEKDKDGHEIGNGFQYYNGSISAWMGRGTFEIQWDGDSTSIEKLRLQDYGLFIENGWILV